MKAQLFSMTLTLVIILLTGSLFSEEWNGRNEKLRNISNNTWTKVCGYTSKAGGMQEVPWAYDSKNKVFVRVGGCTNVYNNEVCLFDLGTEISTFPWQHTETDPLDRPAAGCQRGLAYDPITELVYNVGGGARIPIGNAGLWKGDMSKLVWTNLRPSPGREAQSCVAADTENKVIIYRYDDYGTFSHCKMYDPALDVVYDCPVRPDNPGQVVFIPLDYWRTLKYAPSLHGTMYVAFAWKDTARGFAENQWITWLFDAKKRIWTDLKATGLEGIPSVYVSENFRPVLSWDEDSNTMLLLINNVGLFYYDSDYNSWKRIEAAGALPGWGQMFAYDSEHKVHAFVAVKNESQADVWAIRFAKNNGTDKEVADLSETGSLLSVSCSPNPFYSSAKITFVNNKKSRVKVALYDVKGRLVKTLIDKKADVGTYRIDLVREGLSAGVYAVKLFSEDGIVSRKIVIVD